MNCHLFLYNNEKWLMCGFTSSCIVHDQGVLEKVIPPLTVFIDNDYDSGDYEEVATGRITNIPNTLYRYYSWFYKETKFLVECVEAV